MCLPVSFAFADFQLIEDFSLLDLGNISGQDQWYATSGTANVDPDPDFAPNQVMAVSTNSGLVRHPLTVPNGEAHMMFFRLRFAEQQKYSIGLSPMSSPTEFDDYGPEVGMANQSNDFHVWDDEANPNYVELATLNQHTWYNVWVYVDTANDQYQVWVNGDGSYQARTEHLLASGDNDLFDFRASGLSDLANFFIKTGGGGVPGAPAGPVYIDDIYLETNSGALNLRNPLRLHGDLDNDGFVGISDLNLVLTYWNQTVPPADPAADPSGDGFVGIEDLNEVLPWWNWGTPPAGNMNIPEPSILSILFLAGVGIAGRRTRIG